MIRFEQGKSYLYLFPVVAVLFFVGCAAAQAAFRNMGWGFLVAPAFMGYFLASEVRSGVALDSFWRAAHPHGSTEYRIMIIWQFFILSFWLVLCAFAIGVW
jgi:prepilin signal peptidase PulO-like enzyme (type II secretory pathway)